MRKILSIICTVKKLDSSKIFSTAGRLLNSLAWDKAVSLHIQPVGCWIRRFTRRHLGKKKNKTNPYQAYTPHTATTSIIIQNCKIKVVVKIAILYGRLRVIELSLSGQVHDSYYENGETEVNIPMNWLDLLSMQFPFIFRNHWGLHRKLI